MKKFFLVLYSVCASVVVCAMTESEFDEWKYQTTVHLTECETEITTAKGRLDSFRRNYRSVLSDMIDDRGFYQGSTATYTGSDVADVIDNYLGSLPNEQNLANIDNNIYEAQSLLSTAYGLVLAMTYQGDVDLAAITNLLMLIDSKVASIKFAVEIQTNQLNVIIQYLRDIVVPSSGSPGQSNYTPSSLRVSLSSDLGRQLDSIWFRQGDIVTNTDLIVDNILGFGDRLFSRQQPQIFDVQQNFLYWYEEQTGTAVNSDGSSIPGWRPWFNPNQFISGGCFYLGEFLDPIIQQLGLTPNSDGGFDLSNEGKLLLYMFGQNERKFLCDLNTSEMVNYLANRTNDVQAVDLSSITNYLYKIQQPFFGSFNSYLKKLDSYTSVASGNWNPYNAGNPVDYNYNIVTQYLVYAGDHVCMENPLNKHFYVNQTRDKFRTFQWRYTNVLERIEIYLMALNGLLPTSSGRVDDLGEMLTTEGASGSIFEQATNKYGEAVAAFTSTSNSLQTVKTCFENIVNAFDFRESSGSTVDDTAYFSVVHDWCGAFQMPQISLSLQETGLQSVCEYGHRFFRVIWYLLATVGFSILFFKLAVTGSKAVMRALILISTLLGK